MFKIETMLKGQFRDVSVERIMRMLTRLSCELDIVETPHAQAPSVPIHSHSVPA